MSWKQRRCQNTIQVGLHVIQLAWYYKFKITVHDSLWGPLTAFSSTSLGVNIAERLKDAAREWNMPEVRIAGLVRDNEANMVLGVSLIGWPDIPCFGHTLQLCVGAGLNLAMVSRLTGAARKLVGHFKHCALAMSSLKEKQKALNVPEHTLIQDVVTRWNSTYFMLERLLEHLCSAA